MQQINIYTHSNPLNEHSWENEAQVNAIRENESKTKDK